MFRAFFACIAFICLVGLQNAQGKILRVGYPGAPVTSIDFPIFGTDVINAAAAGDTIQVYQNNTSMGGTANIAKKLFIVGFGYLLDKNPGLQAVTSIEEQISINFLPGSQGSEVQGLYVGHIYIAANNITVTRCHLSSLLLGYNGASGQ